MRVPSTAPTTGAWLSHATGTLERGHAVLVLGTGVPSASAASAVAVLSPGIPSTPAGPGQEGEHAAGPDDRGALPAEQPRLPALPAAPEADATLRLRASQRVQAGGSAAHPLFPAGQPSPSTHRLCREAGLGGLSRVARVGMETCEHQVQHPPKSEGAGPPLHPLTPLLTCSSQGRVAHTTPRRVTRREQQTS